MKRLIGLIIIAAALVVSCEKLTSSSKWKPVSFSATNTAVSLTMGDIIRINCPEAFVSHASQTWADYILSIGGMSTTVVPKNDSTKLLWGNGLHHFYAVYPSSEITDNIVSSSISDTQENGAKIGSLVAAAEAIRGEQTVNLVFQPLFTTIEFRVSAEGGSDVEVTGFRLESSGGSALAGSFKAALSTQTDPVVTPDPSSVSSVIMVDMDPTTVHSGESLTVTVIALPQDLTNLTAYFIVNGEERALPLADQNGSPLVIKACQKTTVTATGFLDPEVDDGSAGFKVTIDSQGVDDYDISI